MKSGFEPSTALTGHGGICLGPQYSGGDGWKIRSSRYRAWATRDLVWEHTWPHMQAHAYPCALSAKGSARVCSYLANPAGQVRKGQIGTGVWDQTGQHSTTTSKKKKSFCRTLKYMGLSQKHSKSVPDVTHWAQALSTHEFDAIVNSPTFPSRNKAVRWSMESMEQRQTAQAVRWESLKLGGK